MGCADKHTLFCRTKSGGALPLFIGGGDQLCW